MAWTEVKAVEKQVSVSGGDAGGRANRIWGWIKCPVENGVSRMALWLEWKEDFWLQHLGGQGCPLLRQEG